MSLVERLLAGGDDGVAVMDDLALTERRMIFILKLNTTYNKICNKGSDKLKFGMLKR